MKLSINNQNIQPVRLKNVKKNSSDCLTSNKQHNPFVSPSFTGSMFSKTQSEIGTLAAQLVRPHHKHANLLGKILKGENITYYLDGQSIAFINKNVMGGDFEKIAEKAGVTFRDSSKEKGLICTTIQRNSAFKNLFKTIKYPILDMPRDVALALARKANPDFTPKEGSLLAKRVATLEKENSYKMIDDILEVFSAEDTPSIKTFRGLSERFKQQTAYNIVTEKKNYRTENERVLNRWGTSLVSAIFAGTDFFNISMLQKDDKDEAKKSASQRFKQEFSRGFASGALTYITTGALSSITKTSVGAYAVVAMLTTLVSEIASRLSSGTPLKRLTPEEAAKIAQERKAKKAGVNSKQDKTKEVKTNEVKNETEQKEVLKDTKTSFKGSEKNPFSAFASSDGKITSVEKLKTSGLTKNSKKKKTNSVFLWFAGIFVLSNIAYVLASIKTGRYKKSDDLLKLQKWANCKSNIDQFDEKITQRYNNILDSHAAKKDYFKDAVDKVINPLTKRKATMDLNKIRANIVTLQAENKKENVAPVLEQLLTDVDYMIEKSDEVSKKMAKGKSFKSGIMHYEREMLIPHALYEGLTKLFVTLYKIMVIPASLASQIYEKKSVAYEKTLRSYINTKPLADKKEMIALSKMFKKSVDKNGILINNKENIDKIINRILDDSRTYETPAATGEIANLSRTLITLVSSLFFINDYRNKVLIESEGKDIQGAKEEERQRLGHKLANFFINGTLMNLFNTMSGSRLNQSLLFATVEAMATEATNETLVRKSICSPIKRMNSRQEIIDYEEKQMNKKGFSGLWTRIFMKLTGKVPLSQKAKIKKGEQKTEAKK